MDRLHDRSRERQANQELGGFLAIFRNLPEGNKLEVLRQVERLRAKFDDDQEGFMLEMKALAEMYGAMIKGRGGGEKEPAMQALRVRLGDLANATTELQKQ